MEQDCIGLVKSWASIKTRIETQKEKVTQLAPSGLKACSLATWSFTGLFYLTVG